MNSTPIWLSALVAPAVVAALVAAVTAGIGGALRRREERLAWLRERRHEMYAKVVRVFTEFVFEIVPLNDFETRIDDEASRLYQKRREFFDLSYEVAFMAGTKLQAALSIAQDIAEDAGHRPYDNPKERSEFHNRLFKRGVRRAKDLEDAARAELGLPNRLDPRPETPKSDFDPNEPLT